MSRVDGVFLASLTNTSVFQFISSGIGVSVAQNILNNRLLAAMLIFAPDVDAQAVLAAGATNLRNDFSHHEVFGIRQSYVVGLRAAWIFSIALAGLAAILGMLVGWKSIRPKAGDVDFSSSELSETKDDM